MPNINQDSDKLPPYALIIYEALMSVPERKMVLADIYNYFRRRYPGRAARDDGWKNSIRHNLSMNGAFVKEPRPSEGNAKRFIWVLSKESQMNGIKSTTRYRRIAPGAPRRRHTRREGSRRSNRSIHHSWTPSSAPSSTPSSVGSPIPPPRLSQTRVEGWSMSQNTPPNSPPYSSIPGVYDDPFGSLLTSRAEPFSYTIAASSPGDIDTSIIVPDVAVREPLVEANGRWHKIPYSCPGHGSLSFGEQFELTEPGKATAISWHL
ncbi:hypothetical protein FN846DRAFT_773639 [Sphaerosporella brunnea]|uniref:Fork-head domain-containing protein n=1 Tax=Sphaerosporella brunnea TaxID=1250544 RepID=A0A5J5F649_9PEZI|nr:hypothetical protein FN846DRAFT_773639 [Sphaerosporella brunnea]